MKNLPEKAQLAIYWVIKNFDSVIELCKNPGMTDEELEKLIETAREKEDYIALALLYIAEIYKKGGEPTGE